MLTWDPPDKRYYEHGLDRGVLYPRRLPVQPVDLTNAIFNSSGNNDSSVGWTTYGTDVSLMVLTPDRAFQAIKNVSSGGQIGIRTAAGGGGMSSFPAGTRVTLSAEVRNPPGQLLSTISFIARDDTNGDSQVFSSIVAGSLTHTVAADGVWTRIYVTGIVETARNLEAIYIAKGGGIPAAGERLQARSIMANVGDLEDFFAGDSIEDKYSYSWQGTPYESPSDRREIVGRAVAWNGLVGLDEGGESGSSAILYRDGVIYLSDQEASDFAAKLSTIYFPKEFGECIGMVEASDGFVVDSQKPQPFSLTYRTLVGSGGVDDMFGYQIHLVYNCMASVAPRNRKSIGKDNSPVEFTFDIQCTPVHLPGFRPTAHYIIDTRRMSKSKLETLEAIIYGDGETPGKMPDVSYIYDLLNYGEAMVFTVHTDGTYTVEGSADNLEDLGGGHFLMKNINAANNLDGTYVVSDGGDTTVILE